VGVAVIFIRAVVYATLFVGFLLFFLPAQLVSWSGIVAPAEPGIAQIVGLVVAAAGAVLAVSCILSFVFVGRGTPAPFDPPRRLVVRGPYRFVRNPMYVGAAALLLGTALYYGSFAILAYAVVFLLVMQLFVRFFEEPVLRRSFGAEYEEYCRRVGRWWPRRTRSIVHT
jgi:protein-S-isoprenylcysteine O-methyltransferase Ste14